MFSDATATLLTSAGHDALHVSAVGLRSAMDSDVLAHAVAEERIVITENAADFVPLLDRRQSAGLPMMPVLVALKAGRGSGGALHARLVRDVVTWARANPEPYAHAHWLP